MLHHGEYDDPAKMTHSRIDSVSRGPNFLQAKHRSVTTAMALTKMVSCRQGITQRKAGEHLN